jgi:hypothetical protein
MVVLCGIDALLGLRKRLVQKTLPPHTFGTAGRRPAAPSVFEYQEREAP